MNQDAICNRKTNNFDNVDAWSKSYTLQRKSSSIFIFQKNIILSLYVTLS